MSTRAEDNDSSSDDDFGPRAAEIGSSEEVPKEGKWILSERRRMRRRRGGTKKREYLYAFNSNEFFLFLS